MLVKKKLYERAALLRAVRFFFERQGYLEVDTPIRQPVLIPEANILPVASGDFFLQTSPELCMKRILASGYEKIFQVCKCFRAQERGQRHLPEFTMLEWYRIHDDYQSLMAETAELLKDMAAKVRGHRGFDPAMVELVQQPPQFLTVRNAFAKYTTYTAEQAIREDCFDEQLVEHIEPRLGLTSPCFLYDYPAALGALARKKESDPSLAERFELYVQGVELANGFSELTDAHEQRRRFAMELERAEKYGLQQGAMPEKFLEDLGAMPEACGIALGIDRLLMLLTGALTIAEVVSFTPEEL